MLATGLWVVTFLLGGLDIILAFRLAVAPGLKFNRWFIVIQSVMIIGLVWMIIEPVSALDVGLLATFSLALPLALLFFTSAALGFYPGFVLRPIANPDRKPIGEIVSERLVRIYWSIALDIALGIIAVAGHFAGRSTSWWVFIMVLVIWVFNVLQHLAACRYIGEPMRTTHRLVGTWNWSKTPYDDLLTGPRSVRHKFRQTEKAFDIFVSYKSEDVAVVRPVIDWLIASGLNVWFAEYVVLAANWDEFNSYIIDGVRRSRYGLLFTNDRYIKSEYCRMEVEQLLAPENCGHGRLLEVKIPAEPETHRQFPALGYSPATEYDGDHRSVLEFIRRATSLSFDIPPELPQPHNPTWYEDPHLGYRLNVAGWKRTGDRIALVAPDKKPGPTFTRNLGGYRGTVSLDTGRPDPTQRIISLADHELDKPGELYKRLFHQFRYLAHLNLERMAVNCRGLHLLFCRGFGQPALSYWHRHYWQRDYAVLLPHPVSGEFTEFLFSFRFRGPFQHYCRYTYLIDRLVTSLEWEY